MFMKRSNCLHLPINFSHYFVNNEIFVSLKVNLSQYIGLKCKTTKVLKDILKRLFYKVFNGLDEV